MKKHQRYSRAFTLMELIVVTAIFIIVTAVTLASSGRFGGSIRLENLAYDIALSIRQAQVYGIAVQRYGASNFDVSYGMHFERGGSTSYVLFADVVPKDGLYSEGELVQSTEIQGGYRIVDLCARFAGASSDTCGANKLDITFVRPEPDAYIRVNDGATLYESGKIILESPRGDRASVVVEVPGQISVQ